MATLQILRQEATGVVYANASDVQQTVRFRNTSSQKTLNGVSVRNNITEVIYNDDVQIEVADGVFANDAVSVRLRVSGASLSSASTEALVAAMAAQLSAWISQGVFKGFNPTSAPVIPAA